MKMRAALASAVLLVFSFSLQAAPRDGEIVRGRNFEGVIFTPEMINANRIAPGILEQGPFWTPSREPILKAEAALPAAIARKVRYPKPVRGLSYPIFYTAKNATRPAYSTAPNPPPLADSDYEDNFLYDTQNVYASEQRQYIGVTKNGRRLLLMNFIVGDSKSSD